MKNLKLFAVVAAFSSILFLGCDKEIDSPVSPVNPVLDKVEPTPCDGGVSPSNAWLLKQLTGWGKESVNILSNVEAGKMAIFVAVFSENSSEN